MSRRQKKIRSVASELGHTVESLTWEPIGMAFEMCGPEGGWRIVDTNGDDVMGYSSEELINNMRKHWGKRCEP